MKSTFAVMALFISLLACQQQGKKNTPAIVGNDRDKHNCIGSAGYTWSELKKECIRPFELPVQLVSADSTRIAGVVFSDDKKQAEVFASSGSYVLSGKPGGPYANATPSVLKRENGKWQFLDMVKKDGGQSVMMYTEK